MIDFIHSLDMGEFRQSLHRELRTYLDERLRQSDPENCLKIDLHCHDRNSDVPDELWGRILGLPETWLKTGKLVKTLHRNGCDVVTVTNHNNARSCWELMDKGHDVLVGAEFTCHFPEYQLFVHVLAYGFTPAHETELNRRRENIYGFLRYAAAENIPVVLPHPLYFYTRNEHIDPELFEKLAVLFMRFELVNGQRDVWQSVLTLNWLRGITPERIRAWAAKHDLDPREFGVDPELPKVMTGGSDDHMGIFAGECCSLLHVPDLSRRLKHEKPSALALEAIRAGRIIPYGSVGENQRLNIALLDYFSQVAMHIQDPGLLRILFHRGETSDKVACFTISNLLLEMRKHKNTQKFYEAIHGALHGKKVKKLVKWNAKKDYRFCIDHLERIAASRNDSPQAFMDTVNRTVPELIAGLSRLIISRLEKSGLNRSKHRLNKLTSEEIVRHFEIPSQLTSLVFGDKRSTPGLSSLNISMVLDSLSFPVLVSMVLLGTAMGSTRLLYQNRRFLNAFADHIDSSHFPRRALYLTDTLRDKNGVSSSLSAKLIEIQRADLPIDFLICHSDAAPEPHLHVLRPLTTFAFPELADQEFRIPDFMEIARIFYEGGYDRIVCSTEGPMAVMALMIKHMFNVPSFFFMHTDWLDYIKDNTELNQHERDRIRRALRFFYKQFSGMFVLNNDHRDWLTGHEMQLDEEHVFLTAHHTQPRDEAVQPVDRCELFPDAGPHTPVLLAAGRLSQEKGIFDLPDILERVRRTLPDARLVVAGTGPAEEELKTRLPDALFLGWVDKARMRQLYAGLDLFVFPSRFDTFGNVVLEAFTYGMPVIAYGCKGPKDIIEDGVSGYLVEDRDEMGDRITAFFTDTPGRQTMRDHAMRRSRAYQAEPIMQRFLIDLGLADEEADA